MDTPLHAAAVPNANPTELKRPETAARELVEAIGAALPHRDLGLTTRRRRSFSESSQFARPTPSASEAIGR